MLGAILPPVVGVVTTTSAAIAVEGLVKLITPVGLKAIPAFAVKIGGSLLAAMIAGKVGDIAVKATESVVETVRLVPEIATPSTEGQLPLET